MARRTTALILKKRGCAVSEAATVACALDALKAGPAYDWVLLDLMLPDGCGIQVIDAMKAVGCPARICVITGCGWEMIRAARRAGAERTFTKPLAIEDLIALMAPAEVV